MFDHLHMLFIGWKSCQLVVNKSVKQFSVPAILNRRHLPLFTCLRSNSSRCRLSSSSLLLSSNLLSASSCCCRSSSSRCCLSAISCSLCLLRASSWAHNKKKHVEQCKKDQVHEWNQNLERRNIFQLLVVMEPESMLTFCKTKQSKTKVNNLEEKMLPDISMYFQYYFPPVLVFTSLLFFQVLTL